MNDIWFSKFEPYRRMVRKHKPLWNFIPKFIEEFKVNSIIDVGGGIGYARQFVDQYVLFDSNEALITEVKKQEPDINVFIQDFTKADVSFLKNKYDLVLMCAIVEHYGSLYPLLAKALEVESRYVLITFFKGLTKNTLETKWHGKGAEKHKSTLQLFNKESIDDCLSKLNVLDKSMVFTLENNKNYSKRQIFDGILLIDLAQTNNFIERVKNAT